MFYYLCIPFWQKEKGVFGQECDRLQAVHYVNAEVEPAFDVNEWIILMCKLQEI